MSSCLVKIRPSSEIRLLIEFLLFLYLACKWKKLVLASPAASQVIREWLLTKEHYRDERATMWASSWSNNHFSNSDKGLLSWAISSWWEISHASPNWEMMWPTLFWLQLCRRLTVAPNFLERDTNGQEEEEVEVQADSNHFQEIWQLCPVGFKVKPSSPRLKIMKAQKKRAMIWTIRTSALQKTIRK